MTDLKDPLVANPPKSVGRLDNLLVALLLALAFFVGSFAAANSEVWLHLASGRRIAQGEWTVGVDPFSFATEATADRPAMPWVQHSWLYSLILYGLYNVAGGACLVLVKALAVVALAWCLLQIPGGKRFRLLSVIYVGLAILASSSSLLLRPQTFSVLFFGVTLLWCYRAGALGHGVSQPRILWRLPLLFLIWANIDAWFIMGPLTVALLWAGTGVGALLRIPATFPAKTMGAVLGVGLLACLVNPHHVRVFMLPPELALLIVPIVDLPDFLGAGGRALRNLQLADANVYTQVSPFAMRYLTSPLTPAGPYIAGLCYYPLLLLGLIAIVVNAAVTKKPGAPGLHPGRCVLWCFLAFLSLIQVRFIPWFALACAPLTVLNLVDWRIWLANIRSPTRRPALLGRALAVIVFLVLLFLAWPGWLHTSLDNFSGERRVAWKVLVDPSLQGAALRLAELKPADRNLRVANFSPHIAHYCAWNAPGVKYFMDSRWSLFPDEAPRAERARKALILNEPEIWQKTFMDRHVDSLVLASNPSRPDAELAPRFWLDEGHWLEKYGDGQTLIFAWSGLGKTFTGGQLAAQLSQHAFGMVPEAQRAPLHAPAWPQDEGSFWSLYEEGTQPLPLAATEAIFWQQYFQIMASTWRGPHFVTSLIARGAEPAGLGFKSIMIPYTLGTMESIPVFINMGRPPRNQRPLLKARDYGPPAAPLLTMRRARQALAENPEEPRVYLVLSEACKALLNDQEDYWANYDGDPRRNSSLRSPLRLIQILTALKTFTDLKPDNAQSHQQIGKILLDFNFLDAALEHLQLAARYYNQYVQTVRDARTRNTLKKQAEELTKNNEHLEEEVKKRTDSYALEAATKPGLAKYGLAMGRGLAKEAVKALLDVKMEELNPKEREGRDYALARLLLFMGQAPALSDSIGKTGSDFAELRAFHAAALGNYDDLDKALAQVAGTRNASRARWIAITTADVVGFSQGPLEPLAFIARTSLGLLLLQRTIDNQARPLAETHALRGIMLLEQGDTAAARTQLEAALQLAGPGVYFSDRPIAERYVELLRAQQK